MFLSLKIQDRNQKLRVHPKLKKMEDCLEKNGDRAKTANSEK
jgi:hypothetical protein